MTPEEARVIGMPLWWEDRANVETLAHWLIERDRLDIHDVPKLIGRPSVFSVEWYECQWDLEHPAAA